MDSEQPPAVSSHSPVGDQKWEGVGPHDEDFSIAHRESDILGHEKTDGVMAAKMALVNDTIDEIGFTGHQAKLFALNGFGYAVDSLILLVQSIVAVQAQLEFQPSYPTGLTIAVYIGMLGGALFWGFSADVIGRRFAFNVSLFVSSVFTIIAGSAPNWPVLGLWTCLSAFGAGGNMVLDTAVFLEYLPSKQQWLLTVMAAWWGFGQLIAGFFAWGFMPNYSCTDADNCTKSNNMGWRYMWFTSGAFVMLLSVLRVTVLRLQETPKFLLSKGRDEQVVKVLRDIATHYNRTCTLTVERLQACGETKYEGGTHTGYRQLLSMKEFVFHLRGLFPSPKMRTSTILVWVSWFLVGLAYPLFNIFLPEYLKSRGAEFGEDSAYITWRNYAITNACAIPGPILAGYMCQSRFFWGRRGTMIFGALVTMIFLFCYTHVRTPSQNIGFTCTITFCLNIYLSCLYAYTPEVFPSAHRGTGNGIAIGINHFMGVIAAVIGAAANFSSVPIYICAALFFIMAVVAGIMPFEPYGRRAS